MPLLAALILISIWLWFVYSSESNYYKTAKELIGKGAPVDPGIIGAIAQIQNQLDALQQGPTMRAAMADTVITIEGAATLEVGKSTAYTAKGAGDLANIKWAVDPPSAADIDNPSSTAVKVTAKAAGPFKLQVTADGGKSGDKSLVATGSTQPGSRPSLPFVGEGYGTIAIALVLLPVIVILALNNVLQGQAIATIIGAVITGVFVVGKNAVTNSGGGGGAAGGGGNANSASGGGS